MANKWPRVLGIVFVVVGLLDLVGGFGIVGADGFFATNTAHVLFNTPPSQNIVRRCILISIWHKSLTIEKG